MGKNFWNNLPKPIVLLAPMDGYTDGAFRQICKEVNPAIVVVTEFVSADGITHGATKLRSKLGFDPAEQPIIAQIFGKDPATFAAATRYCEKQGFSGIDLNMGCPSKKVVKSEHGIALRRNLDRAFKLIEAVATNTSLPVSVKTRLGWSDASDLLEFGRGAQNAGANLLTIHGRTYTVPYSCPADFEPIYELKRQVSIPVIANGGIGDLADGLRKLGNLDGFMIGRAAFGNPWVFDPKGAPGRFVDKVPLLKRHVEYLAQRKGERVAMFEIRKHLLAYVRGIPGASSYRIALARVESVTAVYQILDEIVDQLSLDESSKSLV